MRGTGRKRKRSKGRGLSSSRAGRGQSSLWSLAWGLLPFLSLLLDPWALVPYPPETGEAMCA